jgi:hypothetical protein
MFNRMTVAALALSLLCGCFHNSTPDECAVVPEEDVEVKSAWVGVSGLWLSPSEGCCSGQPQFGTVVENGNVLLQLTDVQPGDYDVTPCTGGETGWPGVCEGSTVGGRYYHSGGQAGGTGTLHIDSNDGHLKGSADIRFSENGKSRHFKGTFSAPTCQVN